jgi:hypothetical protein
VPNANKLYFEVFTFGSNLFQEVVKPFTSFDKTNQKMCNTFFPFKKIFTIKFEMNILIKKMKMKKINQSTCTTEQSISMQQYP